MAKPMSFLFLLQLLVYFSPPANGALYDIESLGARADGGADSAGPLLKAWAGACGSSNPATIYVPAGRFLVSRAVFQGPCRNRAIKFSIDGTIVAPLGYAPHSGSGRWITFDGVDGVSISGGTLDGRGHDLWSCKLAGRKCPSGLTSLTFTNAKNVEISSLTSMNSQIFHIVILGCQGVRVTNVNIVAPGNSPNTDGIHVQMSTGVTIGQTNIRTGDDCVSVGPGTRGLWIENVFCGPGHGISIGSLGKGQGLVEEGVQNVTVKSVVFSGTQNGLRIKSWASTTRGSVEGVIFEHAVMRNVENPIIIDQNYCPHSRDCPDQGSHVSISQVKFVNIQGTSATQLAVNFDCSPSNPCRGIGLQDIKLTYKNRAAASYCKHAYGAASGLMVPPSCL